MPTRQQVLRDLLEPREYQFSQGLQLSVDAVTFHRESFRLPDFRDWDWEYRPDPARFVDVCASYEQALRHGNLTDFEGFVHDAVRALARNAELRAEEAGRFDYWIVDEYQDLPEGKLKLLRLLVAPARNVFVVGDDDQVLYSFAGPTPDIFEAFTAEYPDAAEFVLDTNYRSAEEIVVRSGWLIARNQRRVPKETKADRPEARTMLYRWRSATTSIAAPSRSSTAR